MALVTTQSLTGVPGVFPGGKGGRCVRLATLTPSCAVVMKSGNLNFLEPSGPLQACKRTAFFLFTRNRELLWTWISVLKCSNALETSLSVNAFHILRSQSTIAFGIQHKWIRFLPFRQGALINWTAGYINRLVNWSVSWRFGFLLNRLVYKYRICSRNFRPRVFCAP